MHIEFEELRRIKHQLPTGSISRIATELNVEEQTVRNFFGAKKYQDGELVGKHIQPGPNGGYVEIDEHTEILDLARKILNENIPTEASA